MEENKRELEIKTPCHMRWAELKGDGAKRWCDQCALHVVDGASLTRDEAKDLVSTADDRVCMRIVRNESGQIVHADDAPPAGVMGRVLRYGLTAAAGMLVACGDETEQPTKGAPPDPDGTHVDPNGGEVPEMPPEIMGEVCFPEEHFEELGDVAYPEEMGSVVLQTEPPVCEGEPAPGEGETVEVREMVGRVAFVPEEHAPQLESPETQKESQKESQKEPQPDPEPPVESKPESEPDR